MENSETTGSKIERLRRNKQPKMSQERLAHEAGLARNTLNMIERGQTKYPTAETLEKIALALGVHVIEIIGRNHPDYKMAEMIAEKIVEYRPTITKVGDASSHHVAGGTAGQKPRMVHHKRRAG